MGLNAFIQRHAFFFHNQRHRKNESGMTATIISASRQSRTNAIIIPPTHRNGARMTSRMSITTTNRKLVDVVGQPIDERRRAEAVGIAVRRTFLPNSSLRSGAEALRSLAGQILANQRHPQPGGNDAHEARSHPADGA